MTGIGWLGLSWRDICDILPRVMSTCDLLLDRILALFFFVVLVVVFHRFVWPE